MKSADYRAKRHLLAQSYAMQDQLIADFEALESFCEGLKGVNDGLRAKIADIEGDAATLRGYINTYGETPAMTWSSREHWKNRSVRAELDIEKLKMDAEHLQYERDEAREKLAAMEADVDSLGDLHGTDQNKQIAEAHGIDLATLPDPPPPSDVDPTSEELAQMTEHTLHGPIPGLEAPPAEPGLREAVVKAAIQWYCVREDEEYEQACEDLEKAVKKLPEFDPSAPAGTDKLLSMARSWQEAYHDVALQMVGELRALAAGTEGPGMAAIDESIRLARENRDRFGGERWDGIVWGMGEARRVAALAREGAKK